MRAGSCTATSSPRTCCSTSGEHVYLADFGLSRYLGDAALPLGPAKSLGTADYVAPEQIRGEEVDGRADVYALGCMLYECLAGEPPFRRGTDAATLYAQLEEAPPVLPGLEEVLPKALAKEPAERYATCGELIEDAREALGIAEPKRSRWPLAVAAVGVALIAAALLAASSSPAAAQAARPTSGRLVRIDPATNRVDEHHRRRQRPVRGRCRRERRLGRQPRRRNRLADRSRRQGRSAEGSGAREARRPRGLSRGRRHVRVERAAGREHRPAAESNGQLDKILGLFTGLAFPASARVAVGPSGLWIAAPDGRVGRSSPARGSPATPRFPGRPTSGPTCSSPDWP